MFNKIRKLFILASLLILAVSYLPVKGYAEGEDQNNVRIDINKKVPLQSFNGPLLEFTFDSNGDINSFKAVDPNTKNSDEISIRGEVAGELGVQTIIYPNIGSKTITVGYYVATASGIPATSLSISYDLQRGVTRYSSKSNAGYAFDSKILPVVGSTNTKTISITQTGYYQVKFTLDVFFSNGTQKSYNASSDTVLLNRMARPYPTIYTDPISGKSVSEPSADWTKTSSPVSWTQTDINRFRTWYEGTYNLTNFQWGAYEIHHIRPRIYGGTNDNSNLIPLPPSIHSSYTAFFSGY
ncbi:HNH endonuclease [Paenibacillus caui]|uniref:HNH endonuclease signature motif containing protein n=1 Tax=Paenibacillus caui TaxID=2873927 RepID=UPI001CA91A9D|nr:HNH endonuclease [Paenibacillus caui]